MNAPAYAADVSDAEAFPRRESEEDEYGQQDVVDIPLERYSDRHRQDDDDVHADDHEGGDACCHGVAGQEKDQRTNELDHGAQSVRHSEGQLGRLQIMWMLAEEQPADALAEHVRSVGHHDRNDVLEVATELGNTSAHPDEDDDHLHTNDVIVRVENNSEEQRQEVLIIAHPQEEMLAAVADCQDQQDRNKKTPVWQHSTLCARNVVRDVVMVSRREHDRDNQRSDQCVVEHHIQERAGVSALTWQAASERRALDYADLGPILVGPKLRYIVESRRSRASS